MPIVGKNISIREFELRETSLNENNLKSLQIFFQNNQNLRKVNFTKIDFPSFEDSYNLMNQNSSIETLQFICCNMDFNVTFLKYHTNLRELRINTVKVDLEDFSKQVTTNTHPYLSKIIIDFKITPKSSFKNFTFPHLNVYCSNFDNDYFRDLFISLRGSTIKKLEFTDRFIKKKIENVDDWVKELCLYISETNSLKKLILMMYQ